MRYLIHQRRAYIKAGFAVLSVDAKQRELIGLFKNPGETWRKTALDVLESDYVLFARARGESTFTIMKRHGFRNILLPAVTL